MKKFLLIVFSLLGISLSSYAVQWDVEKTNIALNKIVTTSADRNNDDSRHSRLITDGKLDTRWQSPEGINKADIDGYNDWILIDLGSSMAVEDVYIFWEASNPTKYAVYVSEDEPQFTETTDGTYTYRIINSDWFTGKLPKMFRNPGDKGNYEDEFQLNDAKGRYFLIYCTEYNGNAQTYGSSIYEVKLSTSGEIISYSGQETLTVIQNGNEFPFIVNYTISYLENKSLNIRANIEWLSGRQPSALSPDMFIFIDNVEHRATWDNANLTINKIFEPQEVINFRFKFLFEGGDYFVDLTPYIVGSTNQDSDIKLDISISEIGEHFVVLNYNYSLSDEYKDSKVTLYCDDDPVSGDDDSTIRIDDNTIRIDNLEASTSYSYSFVAKIDDTEIKSNIVNISFTTLRDASIQIHNYQIVNGFIKNAYYTDEADSQRRTLPLSIETDIEYNPDNTLTLHFSFSSQKEIVGWVPQININGVYTGKDNWNYDNGSYIYTTSEKFDPGTTISIFYYPQYNGGAESLELTSFKAGESNDRIEYGTPSGIEIFAENTSLIANTPQSFCAYVVDENGNFLLNILPEISLEENDVNAQLNGDFITIPSKGTATVVARHDELVGKKTFQVYYSENAENLVSGKTPEICEHGQDPEKCTDGINNNDQNFTKLICGETEIHELKFDLGSNYNIEFIKLTWEGASARDYDIILGIDNNGNVEQTELIEIRNEAGGSGVIARRPIELNNVLARYITLQTLTATNKDWGIKLMEIEVYGTPNESDVVTVGDFDTMEWTPAEISLNDVIRLPENFNEERITAVIRPKNYESWAKADDLSEADKKVYEAMMAESASVAPKNGQTVKSVCDGFHNGESADVEINQGTTPGDRTLAFTLPCSGLYEISLTLPEESSLIFNNNSKTLTKELSVYPSLSHKYSYSLSTGDLVNDIFSINDYPFDGNETLKYNENAIDDLKNALVYIPGVFGADIYYWISGTDVDNDAEETDEPSQPVNMSSIRRKANALPEGYENFTRTLSHGQTADLSALANGGTLNLVLAKNGAVTPLENDGSSQSSIQVLVAPDVPTGVDSVTPDENGLVDIYTLSGIRVARGVDFNEIRNSLSSGIYIINGKKILVNN